MDNSILGSIKKLLGLMPGDKTYDEDVLIKRQQLTLKNSTFCPITYYVLEKLMKNNQ